MRGSDGPLYFLNLKGGSKVAKDVHVGAGMFFISDPNHIFFDNDEDYTGLNREYTNEAASVALPMVCLLMAITKTM